MLTETVRKICSNTCKPDCRQVLVEQNKRQTPRPHGLNSVKICSYELCNYAVYIFSLTTDKYSATAAARRRIAQEARRNDGGKRHYRLHDGP